MTTNPLEDALNRALTGLDDAMRLVREQRQAPPSYRVDTLSSSLAAPLGHHVERMLNDARALVQTDADRAALRALARAALAQGLIEEAARDRLLKDVE